MDKKSDLPTLFQMKQELFKRYGEPQCTRLYQASIQLAQKANVEAGKFSYYLRGVLRNQLEIDCLDLFEIIRQADVPKPSPPPPPRIMSDEEADDLYRRMLGKSNSLNDNPNIELIRESPVRDSGLDSIHATIDRLRDLAQRRQNVDQ